MSEDTIESLQKEINTKKSLINTISAQFEAAKQMVNEGLTSNMQLRSNLVMLQQNNFELTQELELSKKQILALGNKLMQLLPPSSVGVPENATNQVSE